MTDQEILTQFENLVDDNLDLTLEVQLANNAKNKLERQLKLLIHQKQDTSQSVSAGQTYATGITLPTDFSSPVTLYLGTKLLVPVPFQHSVKHQNNSNRYWIDYRQRKRYFGGTQASAQILTDIYIYKTTDFDEDNLEGTTLTWPDFHSIIAYEMAKLFYQIDQPGKERSWRAEWEVEYRLLLNALIDWDADLKLAELGGATPYGDDEGNNSSDTLNI